MTVPSVKNFLSSISNGYLKETNHPLLPLLPTMMRRPTHLLMVHINPKPRLPPPMPPVMKVKIATKMPKLLWKRMAQPRTMWRRTRVMPTTRHHHKSPNFHLMETNWMQTRPLLFVAQNSQTSETSTWQTNYFCHRHTDWKNFTIYRFLSSALVGDHTILCWRHDPFPENYSGTSTSPTRMLTGRPRYRLTSH